MVKNTFHSWIMVMAVASACSAVLLPQLARAADEPTGPVRIVNPYPGGVVDVAARALAEQLAQRWKVPVVVEPRPGANEMLAADAVAKAPKDGRTLFIGTEASFANNLYLYSKLAYEPDVDLVPVTELFEVRLGLIVRGDLPVHTLKEFVERMKREGSAHTYASSGPGGPLHLAMEQFRRTAGFEMTHVPYKTIAQMMQDLMGGRIDASFLGVASSAPFLANGRLRLLAVSGATRAREAPDVPTFAELGYPAADYRTSIGLAVTGGTPAAKLKQLDADVKAVLESPAFIERVMVPNGLEPVASGPESFARSIAARRAQAQRLIRALDIRMN